MNRLNFQVNYKACDDLADERDSVATWLKALAIAVLVIGAMVVGAMLNDGNAIEHLRAIAIRQ